MTYLEVEGRQVRVSSLDKVMWPATGTTKGEMLNYYINASPYMLPYLRGRPLSMQRFPNGVDKPGFYQKNCPENAPTWVETMDLQHTNKQISYVVVENMATLVWLVNLGVVEFHPWLSKKSMLDNPDYAVFDLDPMEVYGFKEVCYIALAIKDLLSKLGLQAQAKTSGLTGLQIFMPLQPIYTYKQVRDFVLGCYTVINRRFPQWTTLERTRSKRQGKIYLDYMQNARGQTIVSVYSLRPSTQPTISIPLEWEQLEKGIEPQDYTLSQFTSNDGLPPWLAKIPGQRLEQAVDRLKSLL